MASPLFRREVLNHQRNRRVGEALVIRPISLKLSTVGAVLADAAFIGFLIYREYMCKVHVTGFMACAALTSGPTN